MKITKELLNIEESKTKEWIITNGIGGYAASTITGANTRKYHGLLIAPLSPPARRHLILSKINESVQIGGEIYSLNTNIGKEYIEEGNKYQVSFEKDILPVFKYKVEDVAISKVICMKYGENTVGVYYNVFNESNEKVKLMLTPLINFRDFHSINKNEKFNIQQNVDKTKVKLIIDNEISNPIYMRASSGIYGIYNDSVYKGMYYPIEEERGFEAEENHAIPGRYEIEIEPNEKKGISFICSFEENIDEIDVRKMINNEIVRINELFNKSLLIDNTKEKKTKQEAMIEGKIKKYLIAADNFIVYRPSFRRHTIIAGYPWFLDWGRDSFISFEGLLLIPKRFEEARDVLLTLFRDIKSGLIPNGYSGFDNGPLYNSVDASLLAFETIKKYIAYTQDIKFVKDNLYGYLQDIIMNYITGIKIDNNNIYMDDDCLIVSGTPDTQNTWMDAKCNDVAITPRNGKAVEINSLWYNALKIMQEFAETIGDKETASVYKKFAANCKKSFNKEFYNEAKKCLYDVVGDSKVRPNQLFSMSLSYQVIDVDSEIANNILKVVENELLNDYGLQTLSSKEIEFIGTYEGEEWKRDEAYHQGITWPWLLGLYYNTLKNMEINAKNRQTKKQIREKIEKFRVQVDKVFSKEMEKNGCIGSIAELYDTIEPQLPKGAFAQAWSVAEIFRIYMGK